MMQHWGEGWKWLIYGTLIVIIPFSSLFMLLLWLLKLTPAQWWRNAWGGQVSEQGD